MNTYDKIDILDVFCRILRRRKLVLCLGILFCACLIAYKMYGNQQYNDSLEHTSNPAMSESAEDLLSEDDKNMVYAAFDEHEQLCALLETQKNAPYDTLNPYELNVLSITYRLDLTEAAQTNLCYELEYSYLLRANNYISSAASKNDLVWAKGAYQPDVVPFGVQEANTSSLVFMINVAGTDSEQTSRLADEVKQDFEEYHKILSAEVCGHNLTILEEKTGYIRNDELALAQYNLTSQIHTLQANVNNLTEKFTEEQTQFYEKLCGKTTVGANGTGNAAASPPLALTYGIVKYGAFGLFAGVFIACIWMLITYLLDGRLKTAEEFAQRYGLIVLEAFEGSADAIDGKKVSAVDKLIRKCRNKGGYGLDVKKGILCSNLEKLCAENNTTEICFAATLPLTEPERTFLLSVTEQSRGLRVIVCDNVMQNLDSFERVSLLKKVVLVEKTAVSEVHTIEQYIKICKLQNIQVLGGIIL